MAEWVTCWRCGNSRWPGPAWCATCGAPEQPAPGTHRTYRGVISVPVPPKKPMERRVRNVLVGLAVLLLCVVGVGIGLAVTYEPSQPKTTPAKQAQYEQDRAYCEQVVTATLPPQFTVGGSEWAKRINSCLVDRGSARN